MIERDIEAYRRKLAGLSVRAVGDEVGILNPGDVHRAIERGKKYVLERGIDVEERRIQIDELFQSTLGALAQEVQRQAVQGQITEEYDGEGNLIRRRVARGISARTAGELGRSLKLWAQFLGLQDGGDEGGTSVTMVQLAAPASGTDFESKWANAGGQPPVDVTATETIDAQALPAADPPAEPEKPGQD